MAYEYDRDAGFNGFQGDGYGDDTSDGAGGIEKPRILLMGLRRSGKSSIRNVVFHKMSPNETLFLESTNNIQKDSVANSSFVEFQVWDFPGQIDFFDPAFDSDTIFSQCEALVFVIDAQDEYVDALTKLNETIKKAFLVNKNIHFEVFIHKVDGLSDDHKLETTREIHQRVKEELEIAHLEDVNVNYYLTSIYDHTIFEAFSKVVQKLIRNLGTLETLLNNLNEYSCIEKSFLFDIVSKIYIATDSSPVDMQSYELCSDMIDVVIDVSYIYGVKEGDTSEAYDSKSASVIRLNSGYVLYLREVNKFLALVCLIKSENFQKQGLVDYNVQCFKESIQEVFEVRKRTQESKR